MLHIVVTSVGHFVQIVGLVGGQAIAVCHGFINGIFVTTCP